MTLAIFGFGPVVDLPPLPKRVIPRDKYTRTRVRPVVKPCEGCGKTIHLKPSEISRGWGRFCSIPCRNIVARATCDARTRKRTLAFLSSEPRSVNAIREITKVEYAAVARTLDALEAEGLAVRVPVGSRVKWRRA